MSYFDIKITRVPLAGPHGDGSSPVFMGAMPSKEQWLKLLSYHGEYGALWIEFTDNGTNGDGLTFRVVAGDNLELFSASIPDDSIQVIIESLTSISRLRKAEDG